MSQATHATGWEEAKSELNDILEKSVEQMQEEDLGVEDWNVSTEGLREGAISELWGNVWFNEKPEDTFGDRRERAMLIIKQTLAEHDTCLPTEVNANYEVDNGDTGIACWWSC